MPFDPTSEMTRRQKESKRFDACVIRTHASEEIALAGQRVNHSAKAPVRDLIDR